MFGDAPKGAWISEHIITSIHLENNNYIITTKCATSYALYMDDITSYLEDRKKVYTFSLNIKKIDPYFKVPHHFERIKKFLTKNLV